MNKFKNILTFFWHGIKVFLHLTDRKEDIEKMEEIEKNLKK